MTDLTSVGFKNLTLKTTLLVPLGAENISLVSISLSLISTGLDQYELTGTNLLLDYNAYTPVKISTYPTYIHGIMWRVNLFIPLFYLTNTIYLMNGGLKGDTMGSHQCS